MAESQCRSKIIQKVKKHDKLIGEITQELAGLYEDNFIRYGNSVDRIKRRIFHGDKRESSLKNMKSGSYRPRNNALKIKGGRRKSLSKFFVPKEKME